MEGFAARLREEFRPQWVADKGPALRVLRRDLEVHAKIQNLKYNDTRVLNYVRL
jgi:hypothetical protein